MFLLRLLRRLFTRTKVDESDFCSIVLLLQTAPEALTTDLQLMATVLQSTIAGMKRRLLEADMPEAMFAAMQRELVLVVRGYARACVRHESSKEKNLLECGSEN
jgi:hypothetical protein